MIENNTQLAAALFQMESFADTLEGMRRHAQQTEPSVFAVTSGGFINLLRERIAEIKVYVDALPEHVTTLSSGIDSDDTSNTVFDTVTVETMSQEEVLKAFDQYVQAEKLGHRFVGRNDRYQNHKEKASKYISEVKSRKNTLPAMPDVCFDIIESSKLDAHAFYSGQHAFIAVTTGTIDLIYDMFNRMMSHPDILPHIGVASDEKINPEPLFDMVQDTKHFNSPTTTPIDPIRKQVAEILSVLAVNYVVYHELAHIRFGHLKYEMTVGNRSHTSEKQLGTAVNSFWTSQATEMNADAFATSEGLGYVFRLSEHHHQLPPPHNQAFAKPREALIIWFFAIYSLIRLFGEGDYNLDSLESLTHPPPRVRQMMVIQTVPAWLQAYKPELDSTDFLEASVAVAHLVEEAIAKITHGDVDTTGIKEAIDEKAVAHVENLVRHWTEIRPLILPYSHGEELAL